MNHKHTILLGGCALIATGILYPALFLFLAARFQYPAILDGQAGEVLPKLLAGGRAFRAAWAVYGLLPLLLIPAGTGAYHALRKETEGGMRIAMQLSLLSAFALMFGLLRWSTIHWELAKFHQNAEAPQRELINALFLACNSYLGNYIGEFLGESLMHGFLLITAVAMLRSPGFPKWMAWLGIAVSGMSLIGVFRNVNGIAERVQDAMNGLMLFPIWLIVLGTGLARFSRKA